MWTPNLSDRGGPRYLAIADCLADSTAAGALRAGDRLPPQRDLADALGLTLGTETRAYAEARRRGLARGQVGRGTYVLANDDRWDPVLRPGRPPDQLVDMGPNLPLHCEDPDLAQAVRRVLRSGAPARLIRYQPLTGGHADRMAGREWLARHQVEAEPDEIVVTAGAQHALMILLGTLGRRGSAVLCEESTYPGVKTAASLLGLELEPVAIDGEGLVPEALDRAAAQTRASLLYCMPTLQNPRTSTMSESRRREVAEVCRRRDLRIVEDDVHRLLQPAAPSAAAKRDLRVEVFSSAFEEFDSPVDHYAEVLVFGLIPDLDWATIRALVESVSHRLSTNGVLWITGFTTEDPSYDHYAESCESIGAHSFRSPGGSVRTFLEPGQILELFSSYTVLHHWEGLGPEHRHGAASRSATANSRRYCYGIGTLCPSLGPRRIARRNVAPSTNVATR